MIIDNKKVKTVEKKKNQFVTKQRDLLISVGKLAKPLETVASNLFCVKCSAIEICVCVETAPEIFHRKFLVANFEFWSDNEKFEKQ